MVGENECAVFYREREVRWAVAVVDLYYLDLGFKAYLYLVSCRKIAAYFNKSVLFVCRYRFAVYGERVAFGKLGYS